MMEVFGQGAMGDKYWTYTSSVMVKGSVKRAIEHAYKQLTEKADDQEGFNWIPVLSSMKVWNNNKLIIERS